MSAKSFNRLAKQMDKTCSALDEKASILCEKLAKLGATQASLGFISAVYDGINDVTVTWANDKKTCKIVANGNAAAFIEFGAGVTSGIGYPGNKPEGILPIGSFGQKKGLQEFWFYYGEPGTSGKVIAERDKGLLVKTYGNPPNAVMYETAKMLADNVVKVAKEVFAD